MQTHFRVFGRDDQVAFARLSGDYNPVHLDGVAARRSLIGVPIVHGVHLLLWALNAAVKGSGRTSMVRVRATFVRPVVVGEHVTLRSGGGQCEIVGPSGRHVSIRYECESDRPHAESSVGEDESLLTADKRTALTSMFPHATHSCSVEFLAALLEITRTIGMVEPGNGSLLLSLDACGKPRRASAQLSYRVELAPDERLCTLHFDGPTLAATVVAGRQSGVTQLEVSLANGVVRPSEFAEVKALVIGGTRGIGETTVKLLAAGGAQVLFTYCSGASDAERIRSELGRPEIQSVMLDVRDLGTPNRAIVDFRPTFIGYFATPRVNNRARVGFDPDLYRMLRVYYVDGVGTLVDWLERDDSRLRDVLVPSTAYANGPPRDLIEYARAKLDMEARLDVLRTRNPGIRYHAPRWSRVATDQTVSLFRPNPPAAWPIVLSTLRGIACNASGDER
jgi:hypothetical protein